MLLLGVAAQAFSGRAPCSGFRPALPRPHTTSFLPTPADGGADAPQYRLNGVGVQDATGRVASFALQRAPLHASPSGAWGRKRRGEPCAPVAACSPVRCGRPTRVCTGFS